MDPPAHVLALLNFDRPFVGEMTIGTTDSSRPLRKRDKQFAVKREAVLRAAAELFRDRGYERVSLSDLASALNVTKPTIYYYVHSKEQLLLDILEVVQEQILELIRAAAATPVSGFEKLRRIMIDYSLTMISDYGACLAGVSLRTIDPESRVEVVARVREADALIRGVFIDGERDGSLRALDRTVALHALFGALNWMPCWAKPDRRLDAYKLAETQVDLLLEGVRSPT